MLEGIGVDDAEGVARKLVVATRQRQDGGEGSAVGAAVLLAVRMCQCITDMN